jgi:short-subunit dehydrogenase
VDLAGAVVLITGATRGIGRAVAVEASRRGATIVAVGRNAAAAQTVADEVGGTPVTAELRDPDSADAVVDAALRRNGRLDAVVANAGVGYAGDLTDMPVDRVRELVELNLLGPMLLARAALPAMRPRCRGTLLFVTSIAGALGVPGESVYSATKAGLETFADVLREEVRDDGLTVTTVLPGVVETDFFATRGRPYGRAFPRPISAERAAGQVIAALADDRQRRIVPGWLALPARLRGMAPRTYRALERRFG